jgi:long-chain acyl-CoA synthetase
VAEPTTIPDMFYAGLAHGLQDAMAVKRGGAYAPIPTQEILDAVERLALALEGRGLKKGQHVALLSENRPEWAYTDYACAILGLPDVTIYATLMASQAAFILGNSNSAWVFCSTHDQLQKVLDTWHELPDLQVAVLMEGAVPPAEGRTILSFAQLLEEGREREAERPKVREWGAERLPGDLLTLIYTSGTTADPKGAMLTHGNVVSNMLACLKHLPIKAGDRCLSFLPLTHIFERLAGHYVMFYIGASIYYAESVNTVPQNLVEARPTVLSSVPRIYEKIYAKVIDSVAASKKPKRMIFSWAMKVGRRVAPFLYEAKAPGFWLGLQYRLAKALVFNKIHARTGGRLNFAVSGGAPLSALVMEFFWIMGLPILEGYGLTETSPVITFNRLGSVKPGSVGLPIYDTWEGKPFLKIAEDGEILCHGPNVMLGYWANAQATREAIDADGYFHTGDIGELDALGRLKITDRKKELLVTSGGKKIPPTPIEDALKDDKYIAQAVLIGDQRNFITALIVPNFDSMKRWAAIKKLAYANDHELASLPMVKAKLMQRIERVNATLPSYERIKKIAILEHEMTSESGELTPTLKVKRRVVSQMHKDRIEAMYAEGKEG